MIREDRQVIKEGSKLMGDRWTVVGWLELLWWNGGRHLVIEDVR